MRIRIRRLLAFAVAMAGFALAHSGQVTIPFALDLDVVDQALLRQLFTGPERSAEVFSDPLGCNALTLEDPRVESAEDDQIRITSRLSARLGTPLGGRCLMPLEWRGRVETLQQVGVAASGNALTFAVADSSLTADDGSTRVPEVLWGLVKAHVHPRLSAVTVDLGPAMESLQFILAQAAAEGEVVNLEAVGAIALGAVRVLPGTLDVSLNAQVPDLPPGWQPPSHDPFSEEELARWTDSWQAWDGFATWMLKTLALSGEAQLADALGEVLLDARYDLLRALRGELDAGDPVRELFVRTWQRLAPALREASPAIPGMDALQLATFISAADALRAVDAAAPQLGLTFDSATFRSLARLLVPAVTEADLAYTTGVDPALRDMLGLPPLLEMDEAITLPLAWLIPAARASGPDRDLVRRLNGWVPAGDDLDEYLAAVHLLLEEITGSELEKGKLPLDYYPVYEALLKATAWQESCWRQYVSRRGTVEPIQSSAGSVGLMQVNKHVWRGVYDPEALLNDIAYNARAGNEILVHYLVDYAIKRGEHRATGSKDSLARAAYAAYNGGPGHLSRYRKADNRKSLKMIDDAFWEKYQAIRDEGRDAVKSCYGAATTRLRP